MRNELCHREKKNRLRNKIIVAKNNLSHEIRTQ